jgi:hypothetical protein
MSSVRKVAVLLGAALLLALFLHLALDLGMRRIRYGTFGAFNRVARGQVNAEIVVAGSSRAHVHYDPEVIQAATSMTTFNLGREGAQTIVHAAILRHYLAHNRKPRLIIENADLHSLGYSYELYEPAQYMPYLHDPALYSLAKRIPVLQKAYYLPVYGYVIDDVEFLHYLGLRALFGIQPPEIYRNGYFAKDANYSGAFLRAMLRNRKSLTYSSEPRCVEEMGLLLDEAKTRGIPCILVFSPVYREHLTLVDNLPEVMANLADVARRHGALFWDFSDLSPISGSSEYFADSSHMNRQGATLFSKILGQRLAAWFGVGELSSGR